MVRIYLEHLKMLPDRFLNLLLADERLQRVRPGEKLVPVLVAILKLVLDKLEQLLERLPGRDLKRIAPPRGKMDIALPDTSLSTSMPTPSASISARTPMSVLLIELMMS